MELDDRLTLEVFRFAPRGALVTLLCIFLVLTIFSNVSVLYVLIVRKKMRTPTNLCIASVCMSSLIVGIFVCGSSISELVRSERITGSPTIVCVAFFYLEVLSITASVYSFVATTVDRYRCIVQMNKPRFSVRETTIILASVWCFAFLYASRVIFMAIFIPEPEQQMSSASSGHSNGSDSPGGNYAADNLTDYTIAEEIHVCSNFLEDESSDLSFRIADVVFLFVIPFLIMVVLYTRICVKLWTKNIAVNRSIRDRRKTIKLLVLVVGLFFLCWCPFHVVEITHDSFEGQGVELESDVFVALRVWSLILAVSNSCLNPIVYALLNKNFRLELIQILTRFACLRMLLRHRNVIEPIPLHDRWH